MRPGLILARVRRWLAPVAIVLALGTAPAAQVRSATLDRSAEALRFADWVAAVHEHAPGVVDPALRRLTTWAPATLDDLFIELNSLQGLLRDPRKAAFSLPGDAARSARPIYYNQPGLVRLQQIAGGMIAGGETLVDLVERAAVLHTDLSLHADLLAATVA